MINASLRQYRIPTYADVPRTEVLLVDSTDSAGPMRSKGIAECCINPVAPALANALENATGVRFRELPLTPERIYRQARLARHCSRRPEPGGGSRGHQDSDRRRRNGHHRPEGPCRFRAGLRGLAAGHERRGSQVPGLPRRRDQSADGGAARLGRRLPLQLRRQRAGLDQQRHPAGPAGRGPAVLRRPGHPAGHRRRGAGRRIRW